MPNGIALRVFPCKSLEMRLTPFSLPLLLSTRPTSNPKPCAQFATIRSLGMGSWQSSYATVSYPTQTWQTTWKDMGSPNLSYTYTTYLINPMLLSPRPTSCTPPFFSPRHYFVSPPPDDTHCQVYQSPFDEHRILLCDICNTGWHMDCLLPPLTTIPVVTWKCPLCTPRHPLPQAATRHLCIPSPIRDPDSD